MTKNNTTEDKRCPLLLGEDYAVETCGEYCAMYDEEMQKCTIRRIAYELKEINRSLVSIGCTLMNGGR